MGNFQAINETFNIDLANTVFGIVTGSISTMTALYAFFRFIHKRLNSFQKYQKKLYKKSGIKTWKIKFLLIKIPLNKIPEITRWDRIFSLIILFIALAGISYSGYFFYKTSFIPENWAALTLNSSKEEFLLTYDKATSFEKKPKWMIDIAKCSINSINNIAKENKTSQKLTEFICKKIGNNEEKKQINKYIKSTVHEKRFIYAILSLFSLQMLWLITNTCATLLYKKRLRKVILNEHQKSYKYLT